VAAVERHIHAQGVCCGVAGCALGGLVLYWEGNVPRGMQVATAKQLLQCTSVCWDKTKIKLAFQ